MKEMQKNCRWCSEEKNRCRILIAAVCRKRACSFFETEDDFKRRNCGCVSVGNEQK